METELTTMITQKHMGIADSFIGRVVALLSHEHKKIKSYAVDTDDWSNETECLKLVLDDNQTLTISLRRSK